jgi:flagellar biosynthesis/type III secretory pathway protein FliH
MKSMRWVEKLKDVEPQRYEFLKFISKKRKSPDEILNHGYNLGYGKGFQDGLNYGYADGVREEKESNLRKAKFTDDESMYEYFASQIAKYEKKISEIKEDLERTRQ